jgi:PAS domain S-box-containing protein
MDLIELDFEKAKARHLLFKTRLRSILYGADIDETPVISHLECSLGQWIYDHALKIYGHIPEIIELEKVHMEIHDYARELVLLYKSGEVDEAQSGFMRIELIANRLISLLSVAEFKIKAESTGQVGQEISEEIRVNYKELLNLHEMILDLDKRIKDESRNAANVRKQSEANENKFRETLMQAPVGMAILRGKDFIVEMANASYLELVDKKESELVGRPLFDSLPEVKPVVEPLLLEVMQGGVPFYGNELEVTLQRFGGEEKCFFNLVYQPMRESSGQVSGVIVVATEVTEQVKVKRDILKSENQFRNLVNQSQFAKAIFKGRDLVISIANEALLKLWRRTIEEVEGRKLLEVFPELVGQKFPEIMASVFTTGEIYKENEAEAFVDGPGGLKKFYLDFQYAPMFEIDGSVSAILVSVNDVTEKVEARQQISDAAERLQLATEGTQLATWDLNLKTREIIYSERLTKIFGFEDGTVLTHQDMRRHIHPDDVHNVVEPAFAKALENGVYYYEARVVHPDKSVHWIRTQGKVIFGTSHDPLRMLGTMMDITASKVAEISLKTSEDKFRTLADSMPQFIWTGDEYGNLNYFSQSVYDFSGLDADQIEREGWLQIVHPDDRSENARLWKEAVSTGENFIFEHRFKNKNGQYRWQLSRAMPQKDPEGAVLMWVGTSTDIHDSKLFIDELELKVQQRTRELTSLNEELTKTNMELAQFAYVASHDLQEPLRKIQTFANRIVETEVDKLSDRGKDYLNRMQASSTRMQQLIIDLLTFSRANAVEKNFEETNLNVLVRNVRDQLHESIEQTGAEITFDELPIATVIVYQFEQLLINLVTNGMKFVKPDTKPKIHIYAGQIDGVNIRLPEANLSREYHFISVADNGIGFDPQYKDRIFQVFQRLHSKNEYEGTGIGLAICKKIADNHQGFIDALGNPGSGAVFTIYIPVTLQS